MHEDNVYPRSAEYFLAAPAVQVEEHDAEKDQVLSNAPQIRDTINNLKKAADFYEFSVKAVDDEFLTKPDEFMHITMGNKIAAANLRTEINRLESALNEYTEE